VRNLKIQNDSKAAQSRLERVGCQVSAA